MKKIDVGIIIYDNSDFELAASVARHGFNVAVYADSFETMTGDEQKKILDSSSSAGMELIYELDAFLSALEIPRKIIMFSESAGLSDRILDTVLFKLDAGDVISNFCNMNYIKAGHIVEEQKKRGILYLPTGFPKGHIASDEGLAIMPGGYYEGYEILKGIFGEIAARDENGFICAPYTGPAGSGQYIKMVVDGIEYAMMEINIETVSLIRRFCDVDHDDMVDILSDLNSTESGSYFLEMLSDIYSRYDNETGKPMTEIVSDAVDYDAGAVWCCDEAMKLGMPFSVVYSSVEMRFLSLLKSERISSSRLIDDIEISPVPLSERRSFIDRLRKGTYLAGLCAVAQCFALLRAASDRYLWDLDLLAIARTMQVSTYTRSRSLNRVIEAFDRNNKLLNLFADPYFGKCAASYISYLREIVSLANDNGIPVPAISAALQYLDSYTALRLDSGTIQLAKDYLNNTGFERTDFSGRFHGNWTEHERNIDQNLI